jgi:hypothetical protein
MGLTGSLFFYQCTVSFLETELERDLPVHLEKKVMDGMALSIRWHVFPAKNACLTIHESSFW